MLTATANKRTKESPHRTSAGSAALPTSRLDLWASRNVTAHLRCFKCLCAKLLCSHRKLIQVHYSERGPVAFIRFYKRFLWTPNGKRTTTVEDKARLSINKGTGSVLKTCRTSSYLDQIPWWVSAEVRKWALLWYLIQYAFHSLLEFNPTNAFIIRQGFPNN